MITKEERKANIRKANTLLENILYTIHTPGWKIIQMYLDSKYKGYLELLSKPTVVLDPYKQEPEIVANDKDWSLFIKGRILGFKWLIRSFKLTQFFIEKLSTGSYRKFLLLRGFIDALREFLVWLKTTKMRIKKDGK